MKKILITNLIALIVVLSANAQVKEFKWNQKWLDKIEEIAPEKPEVQPNKTRKILILDRFTGFNHWVTPHTSQVIKVLGKKSGAYETLITKDLSFFEAKTLKQYDAVVLNNNCSKGPRRDQILDMLDEDTSLSEEEKVKKAAELENNLIKYVENGGGLMVVHGAIVMQNNSMAFSEMVGGSFDYHPPQQEVTLELVEPDHPLAAAFEGKS
ncbi:MAG: ThuA domain-containing protein, partial [Draconibacterium sp.]|nr:ThuA domain-containing protein [Draconibacterium sp.]